MASRVDRTASLKSHCQKRPLCYDPVRRHTAFADCPSVLRTDWEEATPEPVLWESLNAEMLYTACESTSAAQILPHQALVMPCQHSAGLLLNEPTWL